MIGLIDSGVGGLSVLAAIEATLPNQSCIYYADTAHFPYGNKPRVEILRYLSEVAAFLLAKGADLLVIACHTATISACESLQKNFPIPVIGMVEPTIQAVGKRRAALLATQTTIDSGVYQKALNDLICMTCPELIQKIEEGEADLQPLIQKAISPMRGKQADTLIVGCTHFAFAFHEIEEELDQQIYLLNPAVAVAKEVKNYIMEDSSHLPRHTLYVSGDLERFRSFVDKHPLAAPCDIRKR